MNLSHTKHPLFRRVLPGAVALLALSGAAFAQSAAVLTGENEMTQIDLRTMKTLKTVAITGLPGKVVGIDVRPADGLLYALAEHGTVATIDPATGKASVKTRLETMPARGGRQRLISTRSQTGCASLAATG